MSLCQKQTLRHATPIFQAEYGPQQTPLLFYITTYNTDSQFSWDTRYAKVCQRASAKMSASSS
jgi:hypothetical protein